MSTPINTKYLIIGNSAGGIGAAEAIREVDRVGSLTIVSDEPYPAYSRPLISEYLAQPFPMEKMFYRKPDFYETSDIQLILGEKAVEINTVKNTVKLENGRIIKWQKLLLATGGEPIVPTMEGTDLKGIFTFNKLDDAKAIDAFLNEHRRNVKAVIIGGGLIGVSVTEALVKRGVEVTIIEMKDYVLNTILDKETADLEAAALEQAGVNTITGLTVSKINSYTAGEVSGVTLDDGRTLPCDMVIIAIGVRPRLELMAGTYIKTNRGIVVDRTMAASLPDIYACGDAAEAYDFVLGENRPTPVWPNAYEGGRVAGLNMAGQKTEYTGGTSMNSLKYFGLNIASAGLVNPPDDGYETIINRHNGVYRRVILKKGKLAGFAFAGDIEKSGIIYNLMKDGVNVEGFKQNLVADDFGLATLPEAAWRSKLARPSASAVPITAEEPMEEAVIGD
ncbi:MAG: NAD(P)/FAD-dependent oxidoreductase [Dehalococcoidales bacterium]|nr:NAD(P)/FAD-dependent oxidoreductase [Dehalococcoidales bacterium]